jgi:hypothetical protein
LKIIPWESAVKDSSKFEGSAMIKGLADTTAPTNPATAVPLPSLEPPVAIANALPLLKNPEALEWAKTIPALGRNSPEYAILYVDPNTSLTTLMFRTPVAVHIKAHTHDLAETHVVLIGGTHVFKSADVLYNVEHGGFLRMPAGVVHEAWLPAGSQTLNILESGWAVNWLHGGPSEEDMDQYPPTTAK